MRNLYKVCVVIGVILILTGSFGGAIVPILSDWVSVGVDLNTSQVDRIKSSSDVSKIEVSVSEIVCDSSECWAGVFQEDVIDTEWRRSVNYCSDYNLEARVCLVYSDYSLEENKAAIVEYINLRLENYADAEDFRESNSVSVVSGVGVVGEAVPVK